MIENKSRRVCKLTALTYLLLVCLIVRSIDPIADETRRLMSTDPEDDIIEMHTMSHPSENMSHMDIKEVYAWNNETTLFLEMIVWGEIALNTKYVYWFSTNQTIDAFSITAGVIYRNRTATFRDKALNASYNGSHLYIEIPIDYLYEEGCIQESKIEISSHTFQMGEFLENYPTLAEYTDSGGKFSYVLTYDEISQTIGFELVFIAIAIILFLAIVVVAIFARKER